MFALSCFIALLDKESFLYFENVALTCVLTQSMYHLYVVDIPFYTNSVVEFPCLYDP